MADLLTLATFGPILDDLRVAFRTRIAEKDATATVRVYFDALEGCSVDGVRAAAKSSIANDEYFPKPKRLRELALQHAARGDAMVRQYRRYEKDDPCPICGKAPTKIWHKRIVRDPNNRYEPKLGDDGKPLIEDVQPPHDFIFHDPVAHGIHEAT